MLYVDAKAAGVIEAKKAGFTLSGVETQSGKYSKGLPDGLPAWRKPLPFSYQSTGAETCFANSLDPDPPARRTFAFHQPSMLAELLHGVSDGAARADEPPRIFLARMSAMPELVTDWGEHKLWSAQITAIRNLEKSLAANKPRALIQMSTGSGKTFTAVSFIYRLIKFAGAPERPQGRWRVFSYGELVARDKASLDIFWRKDESLADSDNLPAPDVIAQEIVEDLEAALEQFRLFGGNLANGRAAS